MRQRPRHHAVEALAEHDNELNKLKSEGQPKLQTRGDALLRDNARSGRDFRLTARSSLSAKTDSCGGEGSLLRGGGDLRAAAAFSGLTFLRYLRMPLLSGLSSISSSMSTGGGDSDDSEDKSDESSSAMVCSGAVLVAAWPLWMGLVAVKWWFAGKFPKDGGQV